MYIIMSRKITCYPTHSTHFFSLFDHPSPSSTISLQYLKKLLYSLHSQHSLRPTNPWSPYCALSCPLSLSTMTVSFTTIRITFCQTLPHLHTSTPTNFEAHTPFFNKYLKRITHTVFTLSTFSPTPSVTPT